MSRSDELTDRLLAYINAELTEDGAATVTIDTELFGGVLDSLRLIHLLAFIEQAIDDTIPDEDIVMDRFATPRKIAGAFWGDP